MDTKVTVRSTRAAIKTALQSVPQGVASNYSVSRDEALENAGTAILAHIHEAFIVKSKGGTDDAGDRWAPLSPVTIAIRKRRDGKSSVRTLLDKKRKRVERGDNRTPAQRRAQNIIKGGKARRRNRYDSDRDDILVDTGALLDSLSPWSDSPDKIFKVTGNGVTLGTRREGAMDHHTGVPERNIPQRRLWPEPTNWPDSWWQDIKDEVVQSVVRSIVEKMRSM